MVACEFGMIVLKYTQSLTKIKMKSLFNLFREKRLVFKGGEVPDRVMAEVNEGVAYRESVQAECVKALDSFKGDRFNRSDRDKAFNDLKNTAGSSLDLAIKKAEKAFMNQEDFKNLSSDGVENKHAEVMAKFRQIVDKDFKRVFEHNVGGDVGKVQESIIPHSWSFGLKVKVADLERMIGGEKKVVEQRQDVEESVAKEVVGEPVPVVQRSNSENLDAIKAKTEALKVETERLKREAADSEEKGREFLTREIEAKEETAKAKEETAKAYSDVAGFKKAQVAAIKSTLKVKEEEVHLDQIAKDVESWANRNGFLFTKNENDLILSKVDGGKFATMRWNANGAIYELISGVGNTLEMCEAKDCIKELEAYRSRGLSDSLDDGEGFGVTSEVASRLGVDDSKVEGRGGVKKAPEMTEEQKRLEQCNVAVKALVKSLKEDLNPNKFSRTNINVISPEIDKGVFIPAILTIVPSSQNASAKRNVQVSVNTERGEGTFKILRLGQSYYFTTPDQVVSFINSLE